MIFAALTLLLSVVQVIAVAPAARAADPCAAPVNVIACENTKAGTPASVWDITGVGDTTLQGFATKMSVNLGDTEGFKIKTTASSYRVDIYRLGWYGGDGARKIDSVQPSIPLPQSQPACLQDALTLLTDCGNWAMSASWDVPASAVSGLYLAVLVRANGQGQSHIPFVVRDDSSHSDLVMQTSDTTWQAYNSYGGGSFYTNNSDESYAPFGQQAYKISYNRPFATRTHENGRDFLFANEYPMIRFLERNGYDVSYISGVDTAARGGLLLQHGTFLSVGHDEYWSGEQRASVEAARDAGVNLAFFSGNEIYWKTRWEASIDGSGSSFRTLVCYKETWENAKVDPSAQWTGTWRDPRFSPPANGGRPENALSGTMYQANESAGSFLVPYAYSNARLWRNTSIANTSPGASGSLAPNVLGYEFDTDADNGFRPAGLIDLSRTAADVGQKLIDYGSTVTDGTVTHSVTQYRASSGALVFSAGTINWAWGLDDAHDGGSGSEDADIQQATLNVLADMGASPTTRMAELTAASASSDTGAPTVAITSPSGGATVSQGSTFTVTGTASDTDGGVVAGVEVSTDGGTSWHPASPGAAGFGSWTYAWSSKSSGAGTVRARATDDSSNTGAATSVSVVVGPKQCPCSLLSSSGIPFLTAAGDTSSVELGVEFSSSMAGSVTGVRFYKGGAANNGTHKGSLWSASGTLLATATFTGESAYGWQTVTFSSPVAITAGTTYIASYLAPNGGYSQDSGAFSSPFVNAPLTASGSVFRYGAGGVVPASPGGGANYWVDVVFSGALVPDTTAPSVVSTVPVSGATGVGVSSSVSVTLSEPIQSGATVTVTPQGGSAVAGVTSLGSGGTVLSFVPSGALAASTQFAVVVSGVKDVAGNTMSSYSWSFTTASASSACPAGAPCTVFGVTAPAVGSAGDSNSVELGMRFSSSVSGSVTGVRFYKGGSSNGGTHTGSLWSAGGSLLATATFSGETTSGWQTVTFSSPVAITAGTTYLVSYLAPNGNYAADGGYFSSPKVSAPLTATGSTYRYGSGGVAPASTWNNSNYWVDVVFTDTP